MDPSSDFGSFSALPHDELVGRLAMAGLLAHRDLAPLRLRLAADWRFAFAAAMRMVARVHCRAAHRRPNPQVPRAAGFADADRGVLGITALAERGHALHVDEPHLTGRQADLCPGAFLGHQLGTDARAAHHLPTAAWLEL